MGRTLLSDVERRVSASILKGQEYSCTLHRDHKHSQRATRKVDSSRSRRHATCLRTLLPLQSWGRTAHGEEGEIFSGCNVENASYGLTNCAERTAIFSAIAKSGPELAITAVAVVNDQNVPCSPCGACRQVIYEFGPDAMVFLSRTRTVGNKATSPNFCRKDFGSSELTSLRAQVFAIRAIDVITKKARRAGTFSRRDRIVRRGIHERRHS